MLSFIISLVIIDFSINLKLNLIEDYFIYTYIGDSQTKLKLLVDPTYPFTYILKSYKSKTKKYPEINPVIFSNIYGNYSGKWTIDSFYFEEENITLDIKYLDIYYKKKNLLKADGVLGLGTYLNNDSNIYYYLNKIPNNCLNNFTVYDKKNKKLSICEADQSTKGNKISIPFKYNSLLEQGLIDISKINLLLNKNELKINNEAFTGLIPLLILTKKESQWVVDNFYNEENKEKSKTNLNEIEKNNINYDEKKIIESMQIKFIFNNSEYLYENNDKKDINYIESFLDLEEFEDNMKNKINKWYLGLDNKDIERIEFDFDKREISIVLYSFKYLIIRISLFILVFGFSVFTFLNIFQKKKEKSQKNENEQELIDI